MNLHAKYNYFEKKKKNMSKYFLNSFGDSLTAYEVYDVIFYMKSFNIICMAHIHHQMDQP